MTEKFVTVKELAEQIGMDRSHARRYILGLGIDPKKRRTVGSGGQLTLTVTLEEAEFVKRKREEQGFLGTAKPVEKEVGLFYVIQLVPELDSKRIKLGFADDINQRLAQHRTSAPTARLLHSWPCKRSWERTVIDALASVGGKIILNEVYEFDNVEKMIEHGNMLFSLLAKPNTYIEISPNSPRSFNNENA